MCKWRANQTQMSVRSVKLLVSDPLVVFQALADPLGGLSSCPIWLVKWKLLRRCFVLAFATELAVERPSSVLARRHLTPSNFAEIAIVWYCLHALLFRVHRTLRFLLWTLWQQPFGLEGLEISPGTACLNWRHDKRVWNANVFLFDLYWPFFDDPWNSLLNTVKGCQRSVLMHLKGLCWLL